MLTRRTALGVLPAGVIANTYVTSTAETQPAPTDKDLLDKIENRVAPEPSVIDRVLTGDPTSTAKPDPDCLTVFVDNCKKFGADFSTHLKATQPTIELAAAISSDSFPSRVPAEFEKQIGPMKGMADNVNVLLSSYRVKSPVSDPFIDRYSRELRDLRWKDSKLSDSDFATNLDTLKRATNEFHDLLLQETRFTKLPLSHGELVGNPKIRKYQILMMSQEDINAASAADALVRSQHDIYKTDVYTKLQLVMEAGFSIAMDYKPLYVHAAVQAYCVARCAFRLLRYLISPVRFIGTTPYSESLQRFRIVRKTEGWTMALLADAYDFFDDSLSEIMQELEDQRIDINNTPPRKRGSLPTAYLGTSMSAKTGPFTDTGPNQLVPIQVTNFYLTLDVEADMDDMPRLDQDKFSKAMKKDVPRSDRAKTPFGNTSEFPPYNFAAAKIKEGLQFDKKVLPPTVDNPDGNINKDKTYALQADYPPPRGSDDFDVATIVEKINGKIKDVVQTYKTVQLEFNCMERMTWALIQVLGKG